jgi:hypothetical protein
VPRGADYSARNSGSQQERRGDRTLGAPVGHTLNRRTAWAHFVAGASGLDESELVARGIPHSGRKPTNAGNQLE